jgi:hypothetical protein
MSLPLLVREDADRLDIEPFRPSNVLRFPAPVERTAEEMLEVIRQRAPHEYAVFVRIIDDLYDRMIARGATR